MYGVVGFVVVWHDEIIQLLLYYNDLFDSYDIWNNMQVQVQTFTTK